LHKEQQQTDNYIAIGKRKYKKTDLQLVIEMIMQIYMAHETSLEPSRRFGTWLRGGFQTLTGGCVSMHRAQMWLDMMSM